jgi:heptosyltransferase-2
MGSSLVVQTSFLGDVVLTTPLIRALAARGPVDVVTTPSGAELLRNNPHIRRLVTFDKRGSDRGPWGLLRLARHLAAPNEDAVAYCAQGSWRSALLAALAGYRRRVGFATSAARLAYTERVPFPWGEHHAARLLHLAGLEGSDTQPELFPGPDDRAAVDRLLAAGGWDGRTPLVALAPGSNWGTKRWPYFPELALRLAGWGQLVVLGGSAERELARKIAGRDPGVLDATGRLSLLASAELLGRCRILIGNDSLPQHLASAMRTPTITIFGPTVPELGFGPLAPASLALGHRSLACRPCHHHGPRRCPLGHWRCMRELGPDEVARAVQGLLARTSGGSR